MDLEAARQTSSLHWTKVSAMACFLFAGAVLAYSLIPTTPKPHTLHASDQIAPARH